MAGSTTSQIKNFRESSERSGDRDVSTSSKSSQLEGKKFSQSQLIQEASRYERYCKMWSILSNVAAIVSVSSAIIGILNTKNNRFLRRFW